MLALRLALGVVGLSAPLVLAPRVARAQEPPPASARVLSLSEVERAALQMQPQMLVARAATNVAEGQAEQARSPLLPQVTATAEYLRETGNFAPHPGAVPGGTAGGPTPGGSLFSPSYNYWSFGVGATQLLYDFGQTSQRYESAAKTVDAQRSSEQTTRLQVVYTVRRTYFNARAMKELVVVARETLDDQNRHLMQVQGFVQAGTQPEIALAQQKAAVANAQVQLISAQNNYETAKAQLNQAAGLAQGTDYDVADEDLGAVGGEDQPLDTLVSRAIANRPEIATLIKQHEAQEATVSSAKGGYGPTLSATAGVSEVGESLDGLVPNWNAGLILNWPIFQGGLTKGQVRTAEASLNSIEAQRSLEELQVRLDVDSARLAVRAAKATIGAAQDAEASAKEQLTLAEQRYATGVGSIIELNDAQVAHTSAAAQVVQARYGLASARAQLLAALGSS
jgi:outer membrane protein